MAELDYVTSQVVINAERPVSEAVAELRAKAELLKETRINNAIEMVDAQLAMEAYNFNGQEFVNPYDYAPRGFQQSYGLGYGGGMVRRSQAHDTFEGSNSPVYQSEQDLQEIRGAARLITNINCPGLGIMGCLTNYVIEKGFIYTVGEKKGHKLPKGMIEAVTDVMDEFFEENNWECQTERELFQRDRVDGEVLVALHPSKVGIADLRTIEPDYLTEQADDLSNEDIARDYRQRIAVATNSRYGIRTADHDEYRRFGYHVQYEPGDTTYYPEFYVEHHKVNVRAINRRGVSDFYPAYKWLMQQDTLLLNTMAGATKLSAIAYILQVAEGTTRAKTQGMLDENADFTTTIRTAGGGQKTHRDTYRPPGSVLNVPNGQEYLPGPAGHERGQAFLDIVQGALRQCSVRWQMSEGMISGDDSNGNMASQVVAGSRFHKYAVCSQWEMVMYYSRIIWKVFNIAFNQGRFARFGYGPNVPGSWRELKRKVQLTIDPPDVDVLDPAATAQARQIENQAGVLSKTTWRSAAGYDNEDEDKNFEIEAKKQPQPPAAPPGADSPPGADGKPPGPPKPDVPSPQGHHEIPKPADVLDSQQTAMIGRVVAEAVSSALVSAGLAVESFNESDHPRADDGKFISAGAISAAKMDAGKANALFAKTTDPSERAKLEKAIGTPVAKPTANAGISSRKVEVGVHVKKLAGNKQEAAEMLASLDAADKSFGGSLSKFMERHPVATVSSGNAGGSSLGVYNKGTGKLIVSDSKRHSVALYDSDDLIAAAVGQRHDDDGDSRKAARDATFLHELGHHIAMTTIAKVKDGNSEVYKKLIIDSFQADERKPSKYGATHPHEYFAESFAAYHYAPERLSPTAKKMVRGVMKLAEGA